MTNEQAEIVEPWSERARDAFARESSALIESLHSYAQALSSAAEPLSADEVAVLSADLEAVAYRFTDAHYDLTAEFPPLAPITFGDILRPFLLRVNGHAQ